MLLNLHTHHESSAQLKENLYLCRNSSRASIRTKWNIKGTMMQSLRFPNLDMSRGIDQIFQQRVTKTHMPDGSTVQPAELTESAKVNLFLSLPSLDDYIAKRLRPALLDTGILVPAQFRLVLSETAASLRGRAQLNRKSAKRLGRLALLLDEEECLLELLQMYRSALLQG